MGKKIDIDALAIDEGEAEKEIALLDTLKSNNFISKAVNEAKAEILKQIPDPPEQGVFSFLPTTLTRISPFFPMSRRELKDRPFKSGMTWETSWGKITVTSGNECLSIYDETVLLAVLELIKKYNSESFEVSTYELAKQLTKNKPSKSTYNAIWKSLERLMNTVFKVEISKGKGKSRKVKTEMMGNILSFAEREHETNKLNVALNIYFVEMFGAGFITNLDLKLRSSLKGDTSKALYRFFQSHRSYEYTCHFLTIAGAINLDRNLPNFEIRKRIRKGLAELKKAGYLKRWTMPKDILTVWKSAKPEKVDN
jgi:hypothetical protein